MATITILPTQKSAEIPDGKLLVEAGELAGVEMEAGCFSCSCGTCAAEVVSVDVGHRSDHAQVIGMLGGVAEKFAHR